MEKGQNSWQIPWRLFLSELVGTAVLLLGGLSIVIFMFGAGSPMEGLLPSVKFRQMTTGFLFGCVGTLITLSTVGKESGAHINPAVTLAFWLFQKLDTRTALGLRGRAVDRCLCGLCATACLGFDGPEHRLRRHHTGQRLHD